MNPDPGQKRGSRRADELLPDVPDELAEGVRAAVDRQLRDVAQLREITLPYLDAVIPPTRPGWVVWPDADAEPH